jgi:hypothetical protein
MESKVLLQKLTAVELLKNSTILWSWKFQYRVYKRLLSNLSHTNLVDIPPSFLVGPTVISSFHLCLCRPNNLVFIFLYQRCPCISLPVHASMTCNVNSETHNYVIFTAFCFFLTRWRQEEWNRILTIQLLQEQIQETLSFLSSCRLLLKFWECQKFDSLLVIAHRFVWMWDLFFWIEVLNINYNNCEHDVEYSDLRESK